MVQIEKELIEEKVHSIITEMGFEPTGEFSKDTKIIDDLGMDSLDAVELCLKIETEYSISIPNEELEEMTTVGSLVDYLDSVINPVGI